jgi:pantoate kinase
MIPAGQKRTDVFSYQNFLLQKHANIQQTTVFPVPMKQRTVIAFCPGHISGYFRRVEGDSVSATGSIGAGIVISEGVTATVTPADFPSVSVIRTEGSGERVVLRSSPPLEYVLEQLGVTVSVSTACHLPIGAGFGLSAAALLATLTAVNRCCTLEMTPHNIAALAHEAEVIHRTGLGDVAACQGGGRVVRSGPGIDGAITRTFDLPGPLYAVSFGPIPTPTVLGSQEQMERVAAAFPPDPPKDAEEFFRFSQRFAEESGLLTREAGAVIRRCADNGVPAGMTMLGNGVFAYGQGARDILSASGTVYSFRVAAEGARVIGVRP